MSVRRKLVRLWFCRVLDRHDFDPPLASIDPERTIFRRCDCTRCGYSIDGVKAAVLMRADMPTWLRHALMRRGLR